MGNEKNCQNINYFFLFPIKKFLNGLLTSALKALVSISLCNLLLFIIYYLLLTNNTLPQL